MRYLLLIILFSLILAVFIKQAGTLSTQQSHARPGYLLALSAPREMAPDERYVVYGALEDADGMRAQLRVCRHDGACVPGWPQNVDPDNEGWGQLGYALVLEPGIYTVELYSQAPWVLGTHRSIGRYAWEVEVAP